MFMESVRCFGLCSPFICLVLYFICIFFSSAFGLHVRLIRWRLVFSICCCVEPDLLYIRNSIINDLEKQLLSAKCRVSFACNMKLFIGGIIARESYKFSQYPLFIKTIRINSIISSIIALKKGVLKWGTTQNISEK